MRLLLRVLFFLKMSSVRDQRDIWAAYLDNRRAGGSTEDSTRRHLGKLLYDCARFLGVSGTLP